MNINWKVRFNNPTFWIQLVLSVIVPVLAYFGLNWSDMTTWGSILDLMGKAANNPVVVVSIVMSIFNAVNDPTTKGLSDSKKALTYIEPN